MSDLVPREEGKAPAKRSPRSKITLLRQTIELGLREQAAPTISAVLQKAVDLALEGDRQMIKLLLELHMSRGAPEQEKAQEKVEINISSIAPPPELKATSSPPKGDIIDAEVITKDITPQ